MSHINGNTSLIAHNRGCESALMPESVCVSGKQVNKVCADIEYTQTYKKLLELANSDNPHPNMKNEMLSFNQLLKRYRELREKSQEQKLDTLNIIRKNSSLMYQQTLNIRFRELISSADIPKLGTLLKICHNKGMGIPSIIGRSHDALNQKISTKEVWRR